MLDAIAGSPCGTPQSWYYQAVLETPIIEPCSLAADTSSFEQYT